LKYAGERPSGQRYGVKRPGARCVVAILVLSVFVAPIPFDAAAEPERDRFDMVVIDAGHGGEDEGARGGRGLEEKVLVLDVAKRVAKRLRAAGVSVTMTRSDDTFVPLELRTSLANDARGDLFISVHANSAPDPGPSGIETFFVSPDSSDEAARRVATRENEAFGQAGTARPSEDPFVALLGGMIVSEHVTESSEFSKIVQTELSRVQGAGRRGVKQAPFVVLMGVQMPASLIEIGFLSNPQDERALESDARRDAIANAIASAVREFGKRYDARRGVGSLPRKSSGG
jgi:N-acetylmuramoyl-L-alanine amidase